MDKVEEDLKNLTDVLSDTLETTKDVFTILYHSYTEEQGNFSWDIVTDWAPEITPFTERFETILAGWTMKIKFQVAFDYNDCVVPIAFGFGFQQDQSFTSYKVILDDFEEFADLHYQINSYGFGDYTQLTNDIITKKEPEYIRMYVVPNTTRFESNHMHMSFDVIICDKLEEDLSNQADVLNDCLEICKDFFAKLYLSEYEADWNANVEPFLEMSETILGGWLLKLNIIQKFDYNRCVLPELNFNRGLTWEEVLELWKNVENRWSNI